MVEIRLNGNPHWVVEGTTVASLLDGLGLSPRPLAVEVNQELVPKAQHSARQLSPGDSMEVVTLVGGG